MKDTNILSFKSFNEGLLDNLSSNINNVFKKVKSPFSNKTNPELKKWDISYKKISDSNYEFYHNKKLIASIKQDGEKYNKPLFKLTIFYYDSEVKNTENLKLNNKIQNQDEQPYAKGSKSFFGVSSAIECLISFWSKKTNSGKSKNSDFKIKI